MTDLLRTVLLIGVLLGLTACHSHFLRAAKACHKREVLYSAATSIPPLKIPPGLDAPDTHASLKIPALNEPEVPRGSRAPCLDEPPNYVTPRAPRPAPAA